MLLADEGESVVGVEVRVSLGCSDHAEFEQNWKEEG